MDKKEKIKQTVQTEYGKIAASQTSCGCNQISCCGPANTPDGVSKIIGYTSDQLQNVPEGANLGLGCGNPVAIASLRAGEIVLDLGSGAGFDCFLAAQKVGLTGRVIGVDMTPQMIERARRNVEKSGFSNIEFRLGEIEHLPIADASIDVIISNCVINLSPDKESVFRETYRVLKTGGRIMISDIVLTQPLPTAIANSIAAYVGCVAGAMLKDEYLKKIAAAGFADVKVIEESYYPIELCADILSLNESDDRHLTEQQSATLAKTILSIRVQAFKR